MAVFVHYAGQTWEIVDVGAVQAAVEKVNSTGEPDWLDVRAVGRVVRLWIAPGVPVALSTDGSRFW